MKFKETCFPVKETTLAQPGLAPLSSHQIPELEYKYESLGLDLVKLAQPPIRPPSPGQSTLRQQLGLPSMSMAPPPMPWRHMPLPDVGPALSQPPTPQYLLHPPKDRIARESQARSSGDSINNTLIPMFQEVPNCYQESMNSQDKDKWLATAQDKLESLTEMGIWRLVDCLSNHKTIKHR